MVVKNPMSGTHVRLHSDLWSAVCHLDGHVALQVWIEQHGAIYGERQLLSTVLQLQRHALLSFSEVQQSASSFTTALFGRFNPLMLRVSLFNPTKLLDALCKLSTAMPQPLVWVPIFLIFITAVLSIATNATELVNFWRTYSDNMQVWYFMVLFPCTKILHELAHGWVLRHLGGEVPEAGISFIVLFPMPYVDATDAWTLQRGQRMCVSGAGMVMDVLLACIGIVLWAHLASGAIANMAFTLALMGAVSVFVFNANPLLKFDGYYLLEDALDSPGLARRSHAFMRYIVKRYVLFLKKCTPPTIAHGERFWLVAYALASSVYRLILAGIICVYLVTTLHELGVLLSLFSLIPLIVLPLLRFTYFISTSKELDNMRVRAVCVISSIVLCTAGFVLSVPMPFSTRTQGVVWVGEQAQLYALQSGAIRKLIVANGDFVEKGQAIIELESMELELDSKRQQAAVRLARLAVERYRQSDPARAETERIGLQLAEYEARNANTQLQNLVITAPVSGRVAFGGDQVVLGAKVSQGDLLAYVVNDTDRVVRAVVPQHAVGEVDSGVMNVYVRFAQNLHESVPARIRRQRPSGDHQLPSAVLANTGFGGFDVLRSTDDQVLNTREKVFHLELEMLESVHLQRFITMGTRAFVTLEHKPEPLGYQWMRLSRQLLLKYLSV